MTPEEKRAYQREYYQRNRDKILAQRHEHYERNRDAVKARSAAYYAANRDKALEYRRQYAARNSEQVTLYQQNYRRANRVTLRAKQKARNHGVDVEGVFAAMWEAQNGQCYLCGQALDGLSSDQVCIDHDHGCCPRLRSCAICRRGLACAECNKAIGMIHDDPARLRRMADALEAAQRGVEQRKAGHSAAPLTLFP